MPSRLTSNTIRPRNPVARSPLLKRGGAHEKSASAKRQQTRQATNALLDDWRDDLEFERLLKDEEA